MFAVKCLLFFIVATLPIVTSADLSRGLDSLDQTVDWYNGQSATDDLKPVFVSNVRKISSRIRSNADSVMEKNRLLQESNAAMMLANISLLNERDSLANKVLLMTNCPSAPVEVGSTTAMISWDQPTQRATGSPLPSSQIGGYFLYYGTNKDNLNVRLKLPDKNIREYTINGLAPGTYYFAVSAYDVDLEEGPKSVISTKTIK